MLYHGSKLLSPVLKRQRAKGAPPNKPLENLNAIYLTPDFSFALAIAVRTKGLTKISRKNRTIEFEHPELFNPEEQVYIYLIDESQIAQDKKILVDEGQIAADIDDIAPVKVEKYKAGEVLKYYRIVRGGSK